MNKSDLAFGFSRAVMFLVAEDIEHDRWKAKWILRAAQVALCETKTHKSIHQMQHTSQAARLQSCSLIALVEH